MDGSVAGRPLFFFPYADGYAALIGIDLEAKPGKTPWRVGFVDGTGAPRKAAGAITVKARKFPVQRLSLPKSMVDLSPEDERRANAESARLRTLFDTVGPERLWRGPFTKPVATDAKAEGFGSRRVINGKPRSPHSGADFAAPAGTPVVASNRGRVALVVEFFFGGRLVALDHGEGLYTLYMHLDRADVVEGALVERGSIIGAVGSTGRATGPHLHWARPAPQRPHRPRRPAQAARQGLSGPLHGQAPPDAASAPGGPSSPIRARPSGSSPSRCACLTWIVFLPALRGGFLPWDDESNLVANRAWRGLGWAQLGWMLTTFHKGHWIPVTWLSFGADYLVWGMEPRGYHLTNVLLHAANAGLVCLVGMRLLAARRPRPVRPGSRAPRRRLSSSRSTHSESSRSPG